MRPFNAFRRQPSADAPAAPDHFSVRGRTVLITGAALGMGLLHAHRAAQDGAATVVLWDRSSEGLDAAVAALEAAHPATAFRADTVDLAVLEEITRTAEAVLAELGAPDLLINNAGVVTGAYFWEHDPARDIHATLAVNAEAPMQVTRAFLPALLERGTAARLVTIASAAGLLSNPRMSVYAASKWAAVGWSDSLRLELEQAGHRQVKVLTVCPSYISTGMFAGATGPALTPIMEPAYVVDRIWKALVPAPAFLMLPSSVRLSAFLKGLLPQRVFDVVVGRGLGVYSSMSAFTGRQGSPRA